MALLGCGTGVHHCEKADQTGKNMQCGLGKLFMRTSLTGAIMRFHVSQWRITARMSIPLDRGSVTYHILP